MYVVIGSKKSKNSCSSTNEQIEREETKEISSSTEKDGCEEMMK
jgi:hypothetical protein